MCRNITALRGLEPPATDEEIRAAALQFVRKISGVQAPSPMTVVAIERAVDEIAKSSAHLLNSLPPRRTAPRTVPPMRRRNEQPPS